jgi:hypothetical protein
MPGGVGAAREQSFIKRGLACLGQAAATRARRAPVRASDPPAVPIEQPERRS